MNLEYFLIQYLRQRPLFLSLIRAKEAVLFQDYLPLKRPVLDIGCGDGFFAKVTFLKRHPERSVSVVEGSRLKKKEILKQDGYRTVTRQVQDDRFYRSTIDIGLDLSNSRIDQAREQGIYKKLMTYDGINIPFPGNCFSTVVSNCVLEHVHKLNEVIGQIHRVMKPGGLFLTTVMVKPWEENLFGSLLLGDSYKNWMRKKQVHLNLLTRKQWESEFKKAGFQIMESIGYLSPQACRLIDFCHYLSVPSLLTYKLFKKWVLFPSLASMMYPMRWLSRILNPNVDIGKSGAIFYVLKK